MILKEKETALINASAAEKKAISDLEVKAETEKKAMA
jgi:hypothetical protein